MKKILTALSFLLVASFFATPTVKADSTSDVNRDGVVNIFDYNLLIDQKGSLAASEFVEFKSNFDKLVTSTPVPPVPVSQNSGPKVGVLFGGLASDKHTKRNETEGVMAFPEWKDRLPYFTVVRSKDTLTINQDDQRVIDQEIEMASAAGLDYFLFEGFPGNYANSSNYGINMYLNSPKKSLLQFAMLISTERFTNPEINDKNIDTLIPYFKDSGYLSWNSRPVLFLFTLDRVVADIGQAKTTAYIKALKQSIKTKIGSEPYLVLIDNGSQANLPLAKSFGFDARSSYLGGTGNLSRSVKSQQYPYLAELNRNYWDTYSGSDLDYIPSAMMGIDPRPKARNVIFHDWGDDPVWVQQGTPKQLADQIGSAVDWVKSNKKVAKAGLVLVAHWSSIAEGQWLVPTLSEGNARLNAIAKVLDGRQMNAPTSPYADGSLPALPLGNLAITSPKKMTGFDRNATIHVTGSAPFASRVNLKLGTSSLFFINVKGGLGGDKDNYNFDVELIAPIDSGRYTLSVSSPDTTNKVDVSSIIIR